MVVMIRCTGTPKVWMGLQIVLMLLCTYVAYRTSTVRMIWIWMEVKSILFAPYRLSFLRHGYD